ncbi:MAG: hypothetical protein L0Y35_09560 [Flammeovirgaceae bacterium]|nr:hypothetical protein [Flammeovirgaceae bacterium]
MNPEHKKQILAAAKKQHESVIHDLRQRIQDMLATGGDVNEQEYDSQQQAIQSETTTQVNLLAEQLEFANRELEQLNKIESSLHLPHNQVRLGSVVITDRENFFVSVSVEKFEVKGEPYFGLSIHSPLFKEMENKKAGESFSYKNLKYSIKEIY